MQRFRAKVCVIGDPEVGKTSLVRRYVLGTFEEARMATSGSEVSARGQLIDFREIGLSLSKPAEGAGVVWPPTYHLDLILWDIIGNHGIPDEVRRSYFAAARGILAVADATRRETVDHLERWIRSAKDVLGDVPLVIVLNKVDLDDGHGTRDAAEASAAAYRAILLETSAKTNENVERAFRLLAAEVVLDLIGL